MKVLRENGITNIVSFLHPGIPFEKHLLAREKRQSQGTGVTVHSLPLKPFVSDENTKNLDKLAQMVKDHPDQKYYLHCYLGKHRVTYGKSRILRMLGKPTRANKTRPVPKEFPGGPVVKLAKGVYFGPTLTDGGAFELYTSRVATIISVLDINDPGDKKFVKKFKRLSVGFDMNFENIPIPEDRQDPQAIDKLASAIKKAKKRVYISSFTGEDRADSVRDAVAKASE